MEVTLAAGGHAHHLRNAVLLERSGKKFRSRVRILVDQHRHGKIQAIIIGAVNLLAPRVVDAAEDVSFGQQGVEHRDHLVLITARVKANIK